MSRNDLSRIARDEHMERERQRDQLQRGAKFDIRKHLKRIASRRGTASPATGESVMTLLDLVPGLIVLAVLVLVLRYGGAEPPEYVDRSSPWLDRFERPNLNRKGA